MEFEYNDTFLDAFNEREFPAKSEGTEKEFEIGSALKLILYFNSEYFNLFPSVRLVLNNEKESEVFSIGNTISGRYYYHEEVNTENLETAFEDIQKLIDNMETFASRMSIEDLNKQNFKKKVSRIFEKSHFFNTNGELI